MFSQNFKHSLNLKKQSHRVSIHDDDRDHTSDARTSGGRHGSKLSHTARVPIHLTARVTATPRTPAKCRLSKVGLYFRFTLLGAIARAEVLGPALGRELAGLLHVVVDLERVEDGLVRVDVGE